MLIEAAMVVVAPADRARHFQLRCRSPKTQLKILLKMADGLTGCVQVGSFKTRLTSFSASGRAVFSAVAQAAYNAAAMMPAPAGIPSVEVRSLIHDIARRPFRASEFFQDNP